MKEFTDAPKVILTLKLLLIIVVINFALLSIFMSGKLLAIAMLGLGIYFIVLGIESKLKNAEGFTLLISIVAAILFLSISGYILSNPLM